MKGTLVKVLIIEDDEDDVLLAREYLARSEHYKFEVSWESDPKKARTQMIDGDFDVYLIDYRLGSENGLDLIKFAHDNGVLKPYIVLTGQGDLKVDVDASRSGAADYLIKSELNASLLERSIRYAVTHSKVIRELNEKEKKYSSLFERSIDPIFLARNDFTLIDLNESFLHFFGYNSEEAKKLGIHEIFADQADYIHFRTTLKEEQQIKDFELLLVNKEGIKRWCLLNCVFIPDQSSDFCCYQGIVHDITLRKKAQKDLIDAERLNLTGKMARIVAHEIRNPLTNLNLALEHLKDEMPRDSEPVKIYSDIIQRNANRIEHLVGEMLNSSKPKELQLDLTSVNGVVEETITLAIDRLNLKEIKLQKSLAEDLPRILVDKEKLKIALLNIIINAIEAMVEKEGVLSLHTLHENNSISIAISDNGKGMSSDELDKLFEPFFTAKPSGLGLGLTSTKNILTSHNADIQVVSEVGKGTTFNVIFKLAE